METAFGYGANARVYLLPGISVYAGWERKPGFELGAGLALAPDFAFTPAVRYRAYSPEFDLFQNIPGDPAQGDSRVSYVALDLGLQLRF